MEKQEKDVELISGGQDSWTANSVLGIMGTIYV